jgi:hypothetical protein
LRRGIEPPRHKGRNRSQNTRMRKAGGFNHKERRGRKGERD